MAHSIHKRSSLTQTLECLKFALLAVTKDADINDIYGKGGSHGGQTPHQGTRGSDNTSFGGTAWIM